MGLQVPEIEEFDMVQVMCRQMALEMPLLITETLVTIGLSFERPYLMTGLNFKIRICGFPSQNLQISLESLQSSLRLQQGNIATKDHFPRKITTCILTLYACFPNLESHFCYRCTVIVILICLKINAYIPYHFLRDILLYLICIYFDATYLAFIAFIEQLLLVHFSAFYYTSNRTKDILGEQGTHFT